MLIVGCLQFCRLPILLHSGLVFSLPLARLLPVLQRLQQFAASSLPCWPLLCCIATALDDSSPRKKGTYACSCLTPWGLKPLPQYGDWHTFFMSDFQKRWCGVEGDPKNQPSVTLKLPQPMLVQGLRE
jgi:hypothetical protein